MSIFVDVTHYQTILTNKSTISI